MDLKKITDPAFLKHMTTSELNELAQEIRSFLVSSISKTGGHLASNLGVVELTIALHYVFDSPKDKIFFDVGHQCYTHKILTGRAAEFDSLRQYGGISGFQKRSESVHDVWEAGHSSTSLSAALGMAVSRDLLSNEYYHVVPVIGDGALTSGMALEALNSIGSEKRNIIIVFNDNNMSISRNVGAMTKSFARLRSAKGYNSFKRNMKEALGKNEFGKVMYNGMKSVKDAVKETVIDRGIFGEFNLEYLGPVDGHNFHDLIRALTVAKEHNGPIVVHVITQKGHGYTPCEKDRDGFWHGVGAFDIETGRPLHETAPGYNTWSRTIADAVQDLAEHDRRIAAITPAMIMGSSLDHFFARFPERSFDCGIAEEHAATFAAGLAISGMRPFLSVYSSFLQRSYDQINHDICRMDLPVLIGIDRAGLVGADGATHHGVFDIGFLRPLPNMIISQPKDADEARNLVYTAMSQPHPFAIRYPRGEVKQGSRDFELLQVGSWTVFKPEHEPKAAILAYGPDVDRILDKIQVNELPFALINCRFLKPIDTDCVRELAESGLPVYVYEPDMLEGGLGTAILEYCNDHGLQISLHRYGIGDHYVPHGSDAQLRRAEKIDLNTLFEDILAETEHI